MEFLLLSRRRSSARNFPSGEERGETDVFAGYLQPEGFTLSLFCANWGYWYLNLTGVTKLNLTTLYQFHKISISQSWFIIHEENAKEISTMMVVWISDLELSVSVRTYDIKHLNIQYISIYIYNLSQASFRRHSLHNSINTVPQVKSKTICFSSLTYISAVLNGLYQGEWPLQASHTIITW